MSIKLMSQVWELEISQSEKIVLLSLADQANDDGFCWPSIPTIARRCSLTERGVYKIIARLEESGFLQRSDNAYGKSNLYIITIKEIVNIITPEPGSPPPLNHVHPTPEPRSGKPLYNHQLEPKKKNIQKKESPYEESFNEFWSSFPKQRIGNKDKAKLAFIRVLKEKRATEKEILDGTRDYASSEEVERGFAKGAAAWLNDDRWRNDYSTRTTSQRNTPDRKTSYMDSLATGTAFALRDKKNETFL